MKGIPMFQAIYDLNSSTFLQNLTIDNRITPLFYFLCIEMIKIMNKYATEITFN